MNQAILRTTLIPVLCVVLFGCVSKPNKVTHSAESPTPSGAGTPATHASAAPHSGSMVSVAEPLKVVVNKSFISPLVELFGDVNVGEKVFVAGNTIVRADPETRICIGGETNLQDNILFLALRARPGPTSACGPRSSSTQNRVSIAHQAVVVNSAIGNFCFIGFHARVENAVLEDGVFVLHGAIVSNVHVAKNRIVPIGAVIKTQRDADALPLKTDAQAKFQNDVLHVNHEFAEHYAILYEQAGFDAVSGVSIAPKTSFNPKQVKPSLGKNVQLSEFTRIVGDVRIGDNSVIGRRTSIRADEGTPIIIGENARIDDRVTFHALEHTSLTIGKTSKLDTMLSFMALSKLATTLTSATMRFSFAPRSEIMSRLASVRSSSM